ncbi:GNAT family N-acetyltransferase [Gordonia sp. HY285]|uniref:GNAT family N-acetyltransferase n=1 Tax=Gordonia liuliyuniae TaxID=2911517 RepID=UPI001F207C2E|nr:GNAT family N-acetyltransferase [Gordonia liuliyuniae]MCF8610156.1 GNAT family N-acetyltransferase [Gordonia liuliyuniae]
MTEDPVVDDTLVTLDSYDGPPRPDARELFAAARVLDKEMSFARPRTFRTPSATSTIEVRTGLYRWSVRTADRTRLAGVITMRPGTAARVLDLVVAPEYRSTGVATAAVEAALDENVFDARQGLDRIVAGAYGSHPAALRLARRFGAITLGERHHMVLPSASVYRRPDDRKLHGREHDDRWAVLGESLTDEIVDGVGSVDFTRLSSRVHTPADVHAAITELFVAGAASVIAIVDARDDALIDILRSAAFGHDRTDTLLGFDSPESIAQPDITDSDLRTLP